MKVDFSSQTLPKGRVASQQTNQFLLNNSQQGSRQGTLKANSDPLTIPIGITNDQQVPTTSQQGSRQGTLKVGQSPHTLPKGRMTNQQNPTRSNPLVNYIKNANNCNRSNLRQQKPTNSQHGSKQVTMKTDHRFF